MRPSEHFTKEELTATDTGLSNNPSEQEEEKLLYLAVYLLEPLRRRFGRIKVNSGFRTLAVNKAINGAKASQHMKGEAADIVPLECDISKVFLWARKNLTFGQLIDENKGSRWIHISLPRIGGQNQQVLVYKNGKYSEAIGG